MLCCHGNPTFAFKDCRFRIEKCKESTARVVVFREFNIMNSFTLEATFYGAEREGGVPPKAHLAMSDFRDLGRQLMMSLDYYLPSQESKLEQISTKILNMFYDEFIKFVPLYILKREEEKKKQEQEQSALQRQESINTESNAIEAYSNTNLSRSPKRPPLIPNIIRRRKAGSITKKAKTTKG